MPKIRCNCKQLNKFKRYRGQFVCKRCGRVFNKKPMGFFEQLFHHHRWRAIDRHHPNDLVCRGCGETYYLPDIDDLVDPEDLTDYW
jgi:hypothetical protein